MKRKTVLRILSCALACTMLFEMPLQAAAVTEGVNLQTDEDGVTAEQRVRIFRRMTAEQAARTFRIQKARNLTGRLYRRKEKRKPGVRTMSRGMGPEKTPVAEIKESGQEQTTMARVMKIMV